jgi:hypothetical protein
MRCAVCQLSDGLIVNIIVAKQDDLAPDGCRLVVIGRNVACDIGWMWNGTEFIAPPEI